MAEMKYYCFCEANCKWETMTKEQIITAIEQAVSMGTISDIDSGFVSAIKEINKGQGLRFWVGTTAEYNAIEDKENNVLYIKTDDTNVADVNTAISELRTEIEAMPDYVDSKIKSEASLRSNADTTLSNRFASYPKIVKVMDGLTLSYSAAGSNYNDYSAYDIPTADISKCFVIVNADSAVSVIGYLYEGSGGATLRICTDNRDFETAQTANVKAIILQYEV